MATRYSSDVGSKSAVGEKDVARTSPATFTSARKYFALDQVQNPDRTAVDSISNAEHIVEQAAGLVSLARTVDAAAARGRSSLAAVRSALDLGRSAPVDADARSPEVVFTETDAAMAQGSDVAAIVAASGDPSSPLGHRVAATARDAVSHGTTALFSVGDRDDGFSATNDVVPSIDHVSIDVDKKRGTVDCFFARLTFSFTRADLISKKIRAVRVFRAVVPGSSFGPDRGRLSAHAIERLRSDRTRSRSKNLDHGSFMEHRLREAGVANVYTATVPIDPFRNVRVASKEESDGAFGVFSSPIRSSFSEDASSGAADDYLPASLSAGLDLSVALDLKSLRNIQLQNKKLVGRSEPTGDRVGKAAGPGERALGRDPRAASSLVFADVREEFVEAAFSPVEKLEGRNVGEFAELHYDDDSIEFGRSYRYYVTTVDENMNESVRSQIVEAHVDGVRVPARPRRLSVGVFGNHVCLTMSVEDQLVEKFEIYRSTAGGDRAKTRAFVSVAGKSGFAAGATERSRAANGFVQVGEALNSIAAGGATFRDRLVVPGRKYTYRVYSVDVFGNKCESPKETEIYVPEPQRKPLDLPRPTIGAEIDAATGKVRVVFQCQAGRVRDLFLTRRDLTLGQKAFVPPGQVNPLLFGSTNAAEGPRRFEGERVFDPSKGVAWTGRFENDGSQVVFVDNVTAYDHVYQYQVHGVDRFGNSTPCEFSRPVFVARRPLINRPIDVSASVFFGPRGSVGGVRVSWQDGNVDISAEDRLGNREELRNSTVRTLYQVERKTDGEERWREFPLVEETELVDPIVGTFGTDAPRFRPEYVELNRRYIYRIQALQTGAFVSNFTDPVGAFVVPSVAPPSNFRIRACDTKCRPFFVTLNWDTDPGSAAVDRWEVERAEVNNIAAGRLNLKNPVDFGKISFKPFRFVFRESSRGQSSAVDGPAIERTRVRGTATGEHSFVDSSVRFGNTYFYEIRAHAVDGSFSEWERRGIKITDEAFEKKLASLLTDEERAQLATELSSIELREDVLAADSEKKQTSFGMQPSFSRPYGPPRLVGGSVR